MEDIVLYVHILCGAIWIGGGAVSIILLSAAKNLGNAQSKPILEILSNLGKFLFAPASFLVLFSGLGLIHLGEWSFSDLWITLAFTGFIVSAILGAVFHPRAGKKAIAATESTQPNELAKALSSWLIIGYIDLAVILSVLAVMVFKPGV